LLSQEDIDADIEDYNGCTLLHWACLRINAHPIDLFRLLIETHDLDVNQHDIDNETPLYKALDNFNPNYGGDITSLAYLINQQNVNVNAKYKRDRSLLHLACTSSDLRDSDAILCQIVEVIISRCLELVLGGTAS
jgi:ankyrin repeat protein